MSMSTGDVRRPSLNKLVAKAAATDKPDPDLTDVEDAVDDDVIDDDESPSTPSASKARPNGTANAAGTGNRPGKSAAPARSGQAAAKAAPAKATPAKATPAKPTPVKATPAKAGQGRAGQIKSSPTKVTAASKSVAAKAVTVDVDDDDLDDEIDTTPVRNRTAAKVTGARGTTKTVGAGPGTRAGGGRPVSGRGPGRAGGGKRRPPTGPVRVKSSTNWGPIIMFTLAGLIAVAIIGYGGYQVFKNDTKKPWQDRANAIPGIHNYLKSNPEWFVVPAEGNHKPGVLEYPTSPPVGGIHNPQWQNCMGDIYDSQVAKEQATHSMEHGAVWITYRPGLAQDQIDKLASKVRNQPFMLMSPYPGLDAPISLQAWGYQLKLDNAGDSRIDDFIDALRQNTTQEPTAGCSGGITDATEKPLDLPSTN